MTRLSRALPAALVAILLGCAAAMAGGIQTTRAETDVAVDIDLGIIMPGETVTKSLTLEVPQNATVVRSEWVELDGVAEDMTWDIALCGDPGCEDVQPVNTGASVPAGTWTMSVSGSLPEDVSGDGYALGVVTLLADDTATGGGVLPVTGGAVPWLVVAFAVGAVGAGALAAWRARPLAVVSEVRS
ncbi:hypothetical protein [Demequina litorisediminis]|uniref:Uncharacterized protein n=1 Tax=Demequina litorisediminis TaxID=1849022 RepID=A0ABQ6I964_9MICO|nr:hypothetical protein [Demequina litorisediminis]GMA34392.1 hypothetical protein GCM10025876_05960 [Demequina litorisediminis]